MGNENFTTTFWSDFSIADRFGLNAVKDTFRRAFREWKGNYMYLTDLVLTLNHKIYDHYTAGRERYAELYNDLWEKADSYASENLTGAERDYFCRMTD